MAKTVRSSGEELDKEVDFNIRYLAGSDLSEEAASKLKEQAEALGYTSGATIFGGGKYVLVCVPDAGEASVVKNVVRSVGLLEIEGIHGGGITSISLSTKPTLRR